MDIFDLWFSKTKAFCVTCGICAGRKMYPLDSSSDLVLHNSINLMCGQWQKCYGSAFMRYLLVEIRVGVIVSGWS